MGGGSGAGGAVGVAATVGLGGAGSTCGAAARAITASSRPAAIRCGPARPGRLIRIRCRVTNAISSLTTETVNTNQAAQPRTVIKPIRIVPSSGVSRAWRTASQESVAGSGLPPRTDQGDRHAEHRDQQQQQRGQTAEHA